MIQNIVIVRQGKIIPQCITSNCNLIHRHIYLSFGSKRINSMFIFINSIYFLFRQSDIVSWEDLQCIINIKWQLCNKLMINLTLYPHYSQWLICFLTLPLSSTSQFNPTRKHTTLGCGLLQVKRSVYSPKRLKDTRHGGTSWQLKTTIVTL